MGGLWDWQPFCLFWVNSGFTCLKDMNADHLKSLTLFGRFVVFSMGRKAKDVEPQVIANLWAGVLMYKGLRDGDPLSDWSSLGWIVPFSFCKNNLNTTNPHQAILQTFCACHYFLTSEKPSSLDSFCLWICYWPTFKMISKKPSKPGFANDLGFSGPKFMLKINK